MFNFECMHDASLWIHTLFPAGHIWQEHTVCLAWPSSKCSLGSNPLECRTPWWWGRHSVMPMPYLLIYTKTESCIRTSGLLTCLLFSFDVDKYARHRHNRMSSPPTGSSAFQGDILSRKHLLLSHTKQTVCSSLIWPVGSNVFTNWHHSKLNVQLR